MPNHHRVTMWQSLKHLQALSWFPNSLSHRKAGSSVCHAECTVGKHYSEDPLQALFFSLAPQGAWKGKRKREEILHRKLKMELEAWVGLQAARGPWLAGRKWYASAVGWRLSCCYSPLWGMEALRCRQSWRRLGGHGGLEIIKGEASFTSLV